MKVGHPDFGHPLLLFSQADRLSLFLDTLSDAFLAFSLCGCFFLRLFQTLSRFSYFAAAFSSATFGHISGFFTLRLLFPPPLSDAFLVFFTLRPLLPPLLSDAFLVFLLCGCFFFRFFRTHSWFSYLAAAFSSATFGRIPGFLILRLLFPLLLSDTFLVSSLCGCFFLRF